MAGTLSEYSLCCHWGSPLVLMVTSEWHMERGGRIHPLRCPTELRVKSLFDECTHPITRVPFVLFSVPLTRVTHNLEDEDEYTRPAAHDLSGRVGKAPSFVRPASSFVSDGHPR